ncbi:MAG: hypothetical protein K2Q21_00525 [Chitinophagaceae bacterium]|nr:hypothetical protein [Chitinophagaceae bacterium]
MKTIVLHIVSRSFILLLALQILNLSVNSIDFKPFETTNLTEFNDINTITEYVSEIVLGHTNAFPEFAKKTQKQSQLQKHLTIKMLNKDAFFEPIAFATAPLQFCAAIKETYLFDFYHEINPPPPKA